MDDFLPVLGRWCRTTIGPTDRYGVYLFQENVVGIKGLPIRQSDPASVVATVTNSSSNNHSITLNIGCIDNFNISGCATTAHASTRAHVTEMEKGEELFFCCLSYGM